MIICEPLNFFRQNRRYTVFCLVYLLGLIAGALYIALYPFSTLMRLMVYPQMSIVIGFFVSALPFIIFYIIFRWAAFYWVLPFAFLKAFSFMYCFGGISCAYADAGWLVRYLVLFSDCFSVPLFLWYASGKLLRKPAASDSLLWFCLLCLLACRCIDSYVVSPFVMKLQSF